MNQIICIKIFDVVCFGNVESYICSCPMRETRCITVSKMASKMLKLTSTLDALAYQQPITTWKKEQNNGHELLSERLLLILSYKLSHAMHFFRMFWI